jgi:hypothetical protein
MQTDPYDIYLALGNEEPQKTPLHVILQKPELNNFRSLFFYAAAPMGIEPVLNYYGNAISTNDKKYLNMLIHPNLYRVTFRNDHYFTAIFKWTKEQKGGTSTGVSILCNSKDGSACWI